MTRRTWLWLGAAVLAIGVTALSLQQFGIVSVKGPYAFVVTCYVDSDIAADQRGAIEGEALRFMRASLGPHPEGGYAEMTSEARALTNMGQFIATVVRLKPGAPGEDVTAKRTYFMDVHLNDAAVHDVSCHAPDGSDAGTAAVAGTAPKQANVIIQPTSVPQRWTSRVLLRTVGHDWRVTGFEIDFSPVGSAPGGRPSQVPHS